MSRGRKKSVVIDLDLLAYNVSRVRKEKGLSVLKLAAEIGCHPSLLYRLEAREEGVSRTTLLAIASVLGVDIKEFWTPMPEAKEESKQTTSEMLIAFEMDGGRGKLTIVTENGSHEHFMSLAQAEKLERDISRFLEKRKTTTPRSTSVLASLLGRNGAA